jgi:DNA-binding transcriptional ArsR family regulator
MTGLAPILRTTERPSAPELARTFAGLGDPTRLAIVRALADGEPRTVGELVTACRMRQPSVSKHLACLHLCGLVARERLGRHVRYSLSPEVAPLLEAAERVWTLRRCGDSCPCPYCQEGRCG